jgi:2-desacetyl-2-hydroxyethyl bacteriochlorophyllide A dehydrogenase
MKTIVLERPGKFSLQEMQAPKTVGENEALVRVHRVGICGTDLHAFEGTQPFLSYPRILGHELAVEIVSFGKTTFATDLAVGEIVAVNPYMSCGTCIACRRGRPNACVRLQVLGVHRNGGMCEYLVIPVQKLVRASGLTLDAVALVEMFSIGAHAVRRSKHQEGDSVLVIGAGPIGLGVMQFARLHGIQVIAMDVNLARLAFCRDVLGLLDTINALDHPHETLQQLLEGDLPTTVFDATGNTASMQNAFQYVAHGGQLVYVGVTRDDITFSDPYFHSHEISMYASRNATDEDFAGVINFMATGAIQIEKWITHRTTPQRIINEFSRWLDPSSGVLKAMLSF